MCQVGTALSNLGNARQLQRRLPEAIRLYEQAFAIQQATLGESHPEVATTLANWASCHIEVGSHESAAE